MSKTLWIFVGLAALLATTAALAGEEGFVYQGKTYVTYKDGVKVGKTFAELFPDEVKEALKRKPANFVNATSGSFALSISFQDVEDFRCFYPMGRTEMALSCVRR